ncbi:glycoside hydrolase superfamily [Kalaharituber pfeilii]|nr:glycoside hydrolase superfamily [Kalaharituber pfeilii]
MALAEEDKALSTAPQEAHTSGATSPLEGSSRVRPTGDKGIELANMSRAERQHLLSKEASFATRTPSAIEDDGYVSSDDETGKFNDSAALLETKDKTSWFTTSPVFSSRGGKKFKRTKISKCAVCIGIVGGIVVLVSMIVGGGVMVLGRKPVAKSEGWYPTPQGGSLSNSPSWQESYAKAQKIVERLSLPAKVNLTTGVGWAQGFCVGNTGPAYSVDGELLFPSLCLQDGPLGLRFADHATAWPAGLTAGATWNRELMRERGRLHAVEARGKGINVILGPAMGPLGRMPAGGRNWEGFGSDPVLQGVAASETIKGIQSEGVIATAKHYIFNEQEHFRQANEWGLSHALSANVDDRTLHELYLWPFAESVKAGVGSIMCSYQQSNNTYSCGNSKLLNGILKDELGFQGFIQSDWLAERTGVEAVLAGLDMTMPGDGVRWADGVSLLGPHLTTAVLNSTIPLWRLNDMATRVVATYFQVGQDKHFGVDKNPPNFSSWTNEKEGLIYFGAGEGPRGVVNKYVDVQDGDKHSQVVRKIAAEGTVLAKNEGGILPLKRGAWKGKKVGVYGEDAGEGKGRNYCRDRGCNQGTLASGWGSGAVEFPYLVTPIEALSKAFNTTAESFNAEKPEITSILSNSNLKKISASAEEQDLCLVFINSDSGEGYLMDNGVRGDRNDLYAQKGGDKLVFTVAEKCTNTIVVIHAVGAVMVDKWIENENVKGLLYAHLPGQESGNSLVDVLFGDVNPSGKLPYTVGKTFEDYGPNAGILYYPNGIIPQQDFTESLYIDYRYFDKVSRHHPRYEFGYGLSYTTFKINPKSFNAPDRSSIPELPAARPTSRPAPKYTEDIPPVSEALYPPSFTRIKKHIYPYIEDPSKVVKAPYNYPKDYNTPRPESQAGGGEGGNPALYEVIVTMEVEVENTGAVTGKEVVQLYLGMPDKVKVYGSTKADEYVDFPVKVLRDFEKRKTVTLRLRRKDLSYWCVYRQNWVLPKEDEGKFTVWMGSSSRKLPVKIEF